MSKPDKFWMMFENVIMFFFRGLYSVIVIRDVYI